MLARLRSGLAVMADQQGQALLPSSSDFVDALESIHNDGPLGTLRLFADAVDMSPDVRGGAPVLVGTRIETAVVHGLVDRGLTPPAVALTYSVPVERVHRALEFERAAS